MVTMAAFIFGVQYFSEKSMTDLVDIATDTSNNEYDFSLPFVQALDDEKEPEGYVYPGIDRYDPNDPNKLMVSWQKDNYHWEGKKYDNIWTHEGKMGFV